MAKSEHKLNVTRPDLFSIFIEHSSVKSTKLEKLEQLTDTEYRILYTAYFVIMESNIDYDDITYVSSDGETVVMRFSSKQLTKTIRNNFHMDNIRIGQDLYQIKIKLDGSYMIVSIDLIGSAFPEMPEEYDDENDIEEE